VETAGAGSGGRNNKSSKHRSQQLSTNPTSLWHQMPTAAAAVNMAAAASCWTNLSNYQNYQNAAMSAAVLLKMPPPSCGGLCGPQNGCDLCSLNI
jgi:hypothetical protein